MENEDEGMAVVGFGLSEKEMELVASAVLMTSKIAFDAWQEDVNSIGNQLIAEDYKELLKKFAPVSRVVQAMLRDVVEGGDE